MEPSRVKLLLLALLLAALAAGSRAAYLQAYGPSYTPDGVEYYSIARNLAAGDGFILDLKTHYYRHFPVRHAAWGERPPLYPLLLGLLLPLCDRIECLFQLNTLFPAASAVLLFLVTFRFTGRYWLSLLGGLLYTFNWHVWINSLGLHTEEPFIAIVLLLALVLPPAGAAPRRWIPVGMLAGLGILLRGNGLLLPPVVAGYLLYRRPAGWGRCLLAVLVPVLLLWSIVPVNSWLAHREAFYDRYASHYRLTSYDIAIWHGYGIQYPTVPEFVSGHAGMIVAKWGKNTAKYLYDLMQPWMLGMLAPLVLLAVRRGPGARQVGFLAAFGIANLLLAISIWSAYIDRYLLPVIALGMPLALRGGERLLVRWPRLFTTLLLVILALFIHRDIQNTELYRKRIANGPHSPQVYAALQTTPRMVPPMVIGATDPWAVYLVTGQPAAMIPKIDSPTLLEAWLKEHQFTHLVLDRDYGDHGRYFIERWGEYLIENRLFVPVQETGRLLVFARPPEPEPEPQPPATVEPAPPTE